MSGPDRSVSIVTGYRLDGPGIESRGGEIFRTCPDRPWVPPSLLYNGYQVFPGGKSGRFVKLTSHPVLVPWPWKGRAIPLLPLWTVRPLHSLSAWTSVHFIFCQNPGALRSSTDLHMDCFLLLSKELSEDLICGKFWNFFSHWLSIVSKNQPSKLTFVDFQ